jgi:carbonic anhydrase
MVNVALQAQTLAAHPLVRARHLAGDLEVIGLFYDIGTAAALRVTPVSVDRLVEVAE